MQSQAKISPTRLAAQRFSSQPQPPPGAIPLHLNDGRDVNFNEGSDEEGRNSLEASRSPPTLRLPASPALPAAGTNPGHRRTSTTGTEEGSTATTMAPGSPQSGPTSPLRAPTAASAGGGGSPYVSPRRIVVPAPSAEAAHLLDTARATVAMLTTELVALRRENSILQRQAVEQRRAVGLARTATRQLDDAKTEIAQLHEALDREQRLRAEADRAADAAAKRVANAEKLERRVSKERSGTSARIQALEEELLAVKVASADVIHQLMKAVAAASAAAVPPQQQQQQQPTTA